MHTERYGTVSTAGLWASTNLKLCGACARSLCAQAVCHRVTEPSHRESKGSTATCEDGSLMASTPAPGREGPASEVPRGARTHLVPGHGLSAEQRACQLHRQPLLVVLGFVLRHPEQHCSCVRGCPREERVSRGRAFHPSSAAHNCKRCLEHSLPTPSFLECSSSVRGAVAPSASIASAASLS